MQLAEDTLRSIDPSRLGLALNFSVYKAEIMHDLEGAISLSKKAFTEAIREIDSLDEDEYGDST